MTITTALPVDPMDPEGIDDVLTDDEEIVPASVRQLCAERIPPLWRSSRRAGPISADSPKVPCQWIARHVSPRVRARRHACDEGPPSLR
jgi:hypothetical protein